ncbi:6-bladed beta-propeller [uncultured Bacteroides sp.]|uniref:6-bladed beta-propeller n=1 Tax=uncultured Bacteroides sp. TaxID=162156 RepID=UPI0025FF35D5|nr:6-bladed beta-propeller [uncultured Bacteroides sp.]
MRKMYLVLVCVLLSCTSQKSTDNLPLPVLNIAEDDYPTRKLDIHDIADVEYIPLESSDSTLLGMSAYIFVSDKYIISSDGKYGGNIYIFDHSGKFLRKFNRKGSGPGEYTVLELAFVDFDAEECNVFDSPQKTLLTYSFQGEFKRSIPLIGSGTGYAAYPFYDKIAKYDSTSVLGYDRAAAYFIRELPDQPLYYLINKKDGSRYPLNLKITNGITNLVYNGKGERIGYIPYHSPILQNGNECWISELSCDTIYSLVDKDLVPVAVQNPSVHSTTPPLAIFPEGFTDYFLRFNVVSLFVDEMDPQRPFNESEPLIWNRLTNQLERWELYNSDFMSSNNSMKFPMMSNGTTMKNCGMLFYAPEGLMNLYKNDGLKGKLKEIASRLREDDNNVIVSIKFNKEKIWKNLTE